MFTTITSREKILEAFKNSLRLGKFIPSIFQSPNEDWNGRKITRGGHILEGFIVAGISIDCISLENSIVSLAHSVDGAIAGHVRLGGISKIEILGGYNV